MDMCLQSVMETVGKGVPFSHTGCLPKSLLSKNIHLPRQLLDSLHTECISGNITQI